ncbi:MAG: DUF2974 domain-containing protein [Lachnospiraceae bacterium]|nr:DUF2974 domain-containing protein [Lachnospiraceae bacterium]
MADLLEYIKWRGDLTFLQAPINEVDGLILSNMSYVDFSDIVPEHKWDEKRAFFFLQGAKENTVTIKEASEIYWSRHTEEEVKKEHPLTFMAAIILKSMAESKRFGNLELSQFVSETDEDEPKQFAAMQIKLTDDEYYLAFRGTDESIVGWMEDFNMVYMPMIPSAKRAVKYIEEVVRKGNNRYYLGGHSKGGHLAFVGAIKAPVWCRRQIVSVASYDGPGVDETLLNSAEYAEMLDKMVLYVPEQSLVGLLMEHREKMHVIKSTRTGAMQHDVMSWEILGPEFVKLDNVSKRSANFSNKIKKWLLTMEEDVRRDLLQILYGSVADLEVRTVSDLFALNTKKIFMAIRNLKKLNEEQKELLQNSFKSLIQEMRRRE